MSARIVQIAVLPETSEACEAVYALTTESEIFTCLRTDYGIKAKFTPWRKLPPLPNGPEVKV